MRALRFWRLAAALVAASCSSAVAADLTLASPDGRVQISVSTASGGLDYSILFGGKPVIDSSPLGIVVDGVNLAAGVGILPKSQPFSVDEKYPWYGGHSTAIDRYNGLKLNLVHQKTKTAYSLELRAYDSGVAFRQVVPGQGTRTPDEATLFRVPTGSTVWYHDLNDHYEGTHLRKNVAALPAGQWVAPPLTFKLSANTGYASITEGALTQYSGMGLQYDGAGGFAARLGHSVPASWPFRLRFKEDVERLTKAASITGTIVTPWRIVMVGADLNALVNSDIVHNVAPPPDTKYFPQGLKTDWVKPGRAVWAYLDGGARTLDGMKEFSRQAGQLGFEYNLLEGFWSSWPEAQLKELVDYSRPLGVRIMIWTSRKNIQDPQKMRAFFEMCKRTGVAGAKIDFFDHEHKELVDLYETILRTAAEYHLIIDFHGANKPTGNERTWPNELGHEGIRGLESQPPWALHEVTLPFTRMLAGLADYTPTHFGKKLGDTTWAHQVANAVILQAPLLCYAANPASMLSNPTASVLKSISSYWDETLVLPGSEIGDVAAFARRTGSTWFVAVTNGPNAKTLTLDLPFLKDEKYRATLVRDTGEAAAVKIENATLSGSDSLTLDLRSGGGFVGKFER
jgi:alpha-glucosidase